MSPAHCPKPSCLYSSNMSYNTYFGTINQYYQSYHQALDSHHITPFAIPSCLFNTSYLVLYLTFSKSRSTSSRLTVFGLIAVQSFLHTRHTRSLAIAYGCFIGVADFWCALLAFEFLFVHDPKHFLRRVGCEQGTKSSKSNPKKLSDQEDEAKQKEQWNSIPPPGTWHRIFWIIDLLGSMRLLHWKTHDAITSLSTSLPSSNSSPYTRESLSLKRCLLRLLMIYILVHILKEIVALDPYFWGSVNAECPEYLQAICHYTLSLRIYRYLTALALIFLAIELIVTVGHLVFLHLLGPNLVGTWGHEASYRQHIGAVSSIYYRGLRGFWGTFWHQFFREAFSAPAEKTVYLLDWARDSTSAQLLRILIPFILSGIVHGCGSYTLWAHSRPLLSFAFFAWQPLGILLQLALTRAVSVLLSSKSHKMVSQHLVGLLNVTTTAGFLFLTFGFLADDYSRGRL